MVRGRSTYNAAVWQELEMHINVGGRAAKLAEHVQEKLTLGARGRFILLFALFDAMFCLVLLLTLQNSQLLEENRQLTVIVPIATEAERRIVELEHELEALRVLELTSGPTCTVTSAPVLPPSTATPSAKP
jgi:hypothetical protein